MNNIRSFFSHIWDYISRYRVLVALYLVTLVVSQFFNPWASAAMDEEFTLQVAEFAKPIQWAFSYFWSGFSDLMGLIAASFEKGTGAAFFYALSIFSIHKIIDALIAQHRSFMGDDGFLANYMRSNVVFSISAYVGYFLFPVFDRFTSGTAMIVIGVILLVLMFPADVFGLVYFLSFLLSTSLLRWIIAQLMIPAFAVTLLSVVLVIGLALLTDFVANKLFNFLVTYLFSKIPILNRLVL